MKVVVVALLLQIAEDNLRIGVGPVGKHDHVLTIIRNWMPILRIDNECAILSGLFLEPAVAVIPVGAALADRKTIDEGLAGRDSRKAQTGHSVHVRRNTDSMPVNRRRRF